MKRRPLNVDEEEIPTEDDWMDSQSANTTDELFVSFFMDSYKNLAHQIKDQTVRLESQMKENNQSINKLSDKMDALSRELPSLLKIIIAVMTFAVLMFVIATGAQLTLKPTTQGSITISE